MHSNFRHKGENHNKNIHLESRVKSFKDFAQVVISCLNDVKASKIKKFDKWDLIQICEFRRKGWLEEDGKINANLSTKYNELGISNLFYNGVL